MFYRHMFICREFGYCFVRKRFAKAIATVSSTHLILFAFLLLPAVTHSQALQDSSQAATEFTLQQCLDYGMQHQPSLKRSLINESITRTSNAIQKSAWYPQVSATAGLTHYFKVPGYNTNGTISNQSGLYNVSVPSITVTQNVFNPSLIYASKVAPYYVKQSQEITDSTKINVYVQVSKSFYNLLLTLQQINVLKSDTTRLGQSVRDAYHQYVGGIVDETDYEQATISFNNSIAQLKQANENIVPQYASLKEAMGFPPEQDFNILYDSSQMLKEIDADTTQPIHYENRIEYRLSKTGIDIQHQLTNYYHLAALPSLSASYDYNYQFVNNRLSKLYSDGRPYSLLGLTLSVPIFTGFNRVENVKRSKLEEESLDWSLVSLKSSIYTEYTTALANYKSNLYNLHILQNNDSLARRVYFVVNLQYKEGIVPYLNVITAESNLISSEIGYLNALFQVLSSKIDLEKALGDIKY